MILEVHVLSWTLHIALLRKLESITDQPEHCLKHKFKVNESNWKGRTLFKGMLHQQFIRNPFFFTLYVVSSLQNRVSADDAAM